MVARRNAEPHRPATFREVSGPQVPLEQCVAQFTREQLIDRLDRTHGADERADQAVADKLAIVGNILQ